MYNIAITKEGGTAFHNGADGKPAPYPTLADALMSAQYLGLTRKDVELHFVKAGASIGAVMPKIPAETTPGTGTAGQEPALEKMNKEKLLAYAAEKGIAANAENTKAEIIAAIKAAESPAVGTGDATATQETPQNENGQQA